MKAIISQKYGTPDDLILTNLEKPVPTSKQVLVKVHAASLNYSNLVLLSGKPFLARFAFGLRKPKYSVPGSDMAGTVEKVGDDVTLFQPGDDVFGDLSIFGWGAFSEYVCVPEDALVLKPSTVTFEEAAATPMAGATALQALRNKGTIQKGQKILIYGASGGVGTFAVQIAKAFGAEVTGVCSTRNMEILKTLGADYCFDYQKEEIPFKEAYYDLILGVNGSNSISDYKHALKKNGTFIHVGGAQSQLFQTMLNGPFASFMDKKNITNLLHRTNHDDLLFLKDLLENGDIKPVIDKTFSLDSISDAYQYLEEGHAQGKIIITF